LFSDPNLLFAIKPQRKKQNNLIAHSCFRVYIHSICN